MDRSNPFGEGVNWRPKVDLVGFSERKARFEAAIAADESRVAEQLVETIPDGLEDWTAEFFHDTASVTRFLSILGEGHSFDHLDHLDGTYGFRDRRTAVNAFRRLRTAWRGMIDVRIGNDEGRPRIKFSLVREDELDEELAEVS